MPLRRVIYSPLAPPSFVCAECCHLLHHRRNSPPSPSRIEAEHRLPCTTEPPCPRPTNRRSLTPPAHIASPVHHSPLATHSPTAALPSDRVTTRHHSPFASQDNHGLAAAFSHASPSSPETACTLTFAQTAMALSLLAFWRFRHCAPRDPSPSLASCPRQPWSVAAASRQPIASLRREGRRCFSCRRAPSPHQGRAPPSPRTQVTAALVARRRSSARRQSWETSLSLSCLKAVIAFPTTELLRYRIEAKHRSSFAAASRPSTEVGKLTRSGWKTRRSNTVLISPNSSGTQPISQIVVLFF